jgi:hypothetical protein
MKNEETIAEIANLEGQIAMFREENDPDLVVAIEALEAELAALLITQEGTDPSMEEPTNNQPDETAAATNPPATVNQVSVDAELLQELLNDRRTLQIEKKIAAMGSEYNTRRSALICRRAIKKYPNIVPKEDVLAFAAIHTLRSNLPNKAKKIYVYDNEIKAYRQLEDAGSDITLEAITELVKSFPKEEVDEDIDDLP